MNFELTKSFQIKAKKLTTKDPTLRKVFAKQFNLFTKDPFYPSLKTHKLRGERSEQFAIWIKGDIRALAIKTKSKYVFFDIITHDEY